MKELNNKEDEIIIITQDKVLTFNKSEPSELSLLINFVIMLMDRNLSYDTGYLNKAYMYDKVVNILIQHKNILKYIDTIPEKLNFYIDSFESKKYGDFTHWGFLDLLTYFYGSFSLLGVLYQSMTSLIKLYDLNIDFQKYKKSVDDFHDVRSNLLIHGLENDVLEDNYHSDSLSGVNMRSFLDESVVLKYFVGSETEELNFIEEYYKYLIIFLQIFIEVFLKNDLRQITDNELWQDDDYILFYE